MSDSAAPTALLDGRVAAGQKAMLQGCLLALAGLAMAIAMFSVGFLVWDQKEREAGRTMIEAQKGQGYIATVVSGYAAALGRPRGF